MAHKKLCKTLKILAGAAGIAFVGMQLVAKKKKTDYTYKNEPEEQNPFEGKKVVFVKNDNDAENADGVRGHLEESGVVFTQESLYSKYAKRALDVVLSFGGLLVLSPVYAAIALAIKIEDPGPVLFTQKRLGKNKEYFKLHKFRSMKVSTPHDVPTHQLDNPDQYITKVGKFIRAHSLDELPQIWDIFVGNMSVIGPRPGLWNQDLLTAERDKYGANDVKPGLTGWAQINGRDELEIPVKAKLDGEYVQKQSLLFDMKCFLGTISKVSHDDSVVEGGTGEMKKKPYHYTDGKSDEELIGNIGFGEPVEVDPEAKKKVLITGAGSYIGQSFIQYAKNHYPDNFEIEELDMTDVAWKDKDFSEYDVVYHVAGIAHADVGKVSEEIKSKYYEVNTGLAVEAAEKAKREGVKTFIFMSSMIVYGDSAPYGQQKVIDETTVLKPANFYGDSKLQADVAVRELANDTYTVIVLRPPMIYGKDSKGNYRTLAKLAKKLPVFPNVDNERSMLYIENLCELLCQVMLLKPYHRNSVVLLPQNGEWTKTSDMVEMIAKASGKKITELKCLAPAVWIGSKMQGKIGGMVNKAFGNSCYAHEISVCPEIDYQRVILRESIERTEKTHIYKAKGNMIQDEKPKALMIASVASMIDQFNMDNISILLKLGYEVHVAADFVDGGTINQERIENLKTRLLEMGVDVFHIVIPRKITAINKIITAYKEVKDLCDANCYRIVHCHSPIGGVVARMAARDIRKKGTKVIYTAHGFHFYDGAPKKNWLMFYPVEKECSRLTDVLITINKEDYNRAKKSFHAKETMYVPGVGVDTDKFSSGLIDIALKRNELGVEKNQYMFLSVGELSKRENHEVVIKALSKIDTVDYKYFIVGKGELEKYLEDLVKALGLENKVYLLGYRTDVSELCQAADLFIFPSHQEGLPVALMEAIACKTNVICSNIRGNVDLVLDDAYLFDEHNANAVVDCINALVDSKKREIFLEDSKEMVLKNYNHLKKFDLLAVREAMRKIYSEKSGGQYIQLNRLIFRQQFLLEHGLELDSILLFSVGELNNNKNHQIIVDAVAKLHNDKIHYFIAGEGSEKENLVLLAEKLGVVNQLHLLGFRTDVEQLLRIMDVYCLPSIREGLNVSLMEAMASGLLCVASKIRGNVDLIKNGVTGFLCDPFDVDDVTSAMINVIELQSELTYNDNKNLIDGKYSKHTVNSIMEDLYKRYI